MYLSWKVYSSVGISVGLILTLIVLLAVVISSLLILYLLGKFPLVRFISAGELDLVAMIVFPSSSHFQ